MTTLTTAEKLDAIESSGFRLAFDGCHKLYFCETEAQVLDAQDSAYEIHDASEVRSLITLSCGLVFVHPWSLQDHPWDVEQFDDDLMYAFFPEADED